jgi:hypothetical protein
VRLNQSRYRSRLSARNQAALFQSVALLSQRGDAVVVRDDDKAIIAFLMQAQEQVDNLVAGGDIEIAGGFIGKEKCGIIPKRTGDGDALLLAARKFRGPVMQAATKTDLVEQMRGVIWVTASRESRREFDIFQCGKFREKMIGLKDEADGEITPRGELCTRPGINRFAFPTHLACVGVFQSAKNLQ